MGPDTFSDFGYGSGSSTNSGRSWPSQDPWPEFKSGLGRRRTSSSFLDCQGCHLNCLSGGCRYDIGYAHPASRAAANSTPIHPMVMNQCTLEDALEEFRLNGSDSPYNPDEERWNNRQADPLVGMGPSSVYLRQKSWPQPESTPSMQLPRQTAEWKLNVEDFVPRASQSQTSEVPLEVSPPQYLEQQDIITEEQVRLLSSLPNDVLYTLLRELEGQGFERKPKRRPNELQQECRFCKNNGEREAYYRSHALKRGARVTCPVLRAFVCRRCGASGDHAHTAKYCPLATSDERKKSAAMMRSVRLASGRRRSVPSTELVRFGAASRAVVDDNHAFANFLDTPLHPEWAALEQKLLL